MQRLYAVQKVLSVLMQRLYAVQKVLSVLMRRLYAVQKVLSVLMRRLCAVQKVHLLSRDDFTMLDRGPFCKRTEMRPPPSRIKKSNGLP